MAEPFLAEIRIFSFVFAPKGWALANGQLLPINQNQGLFALLGTTYGGNGQVNFALPDLKGRVPIHFNNEYVLGQRAGEQAHTVGVSELPQHTHTLKASGNGATHTALSNTRYPAVAEENIYGASPNIAMAGTTGAIGGSQAHLNMQPFLTLSFCIALQGIFPSPN